MLHSLNIIFSTIGCIIGWGAFLAPESLFIPKIGLENSILGIMIGSFLISIVTYAMLEKYRIFFLEWFLILGYLCISSLNLINILIIFQKYFNLSISESEKIIINAAIVFIFFFLHYFNQHILNRIYNAISFVFFLLLLCVELGLIYILCLQDVGIKKLSYTAINPQQIIEMVSISPWLFIGFGYALNHANKHKILLTIGAILFSAFIYLSIIFFVGTSRSISLWDVIQNYFGQNGILFLFLTIFFSIISGFIGFILLALNGFKENISKKRSNILFPLSLFLLTLLGKNDLELLITIVSLAFSLMFVIYAYLFFTKQKTFFALCSFFCAILILGTSLLPQNESLYNKITISILILWFLLGLFLRYDYKKIK